MTARRRTEKVRCKGFLITPPENYYDGPMIVSDGWKDFISKHTEGAVGRKRSAAAAARMVGNKLRGVK